MTCTLSWVRTEVREPPSFYVQTDLEEFLTKFELQVLEIQGLLVLYIFLKEILACWWGTHKEKIHDWYQCKQLLYIRFDIEHENKHM
jgi:hypothetical protein